MLLFKMHELANFSNQQMMLKCSRKVAAEIKTISELLLMEINSQLLIKLRRRVIRTECG